MSDYWDHPEYGELEKKFEKQVASTRKWMALHDEAVERETALSAEVKSLRTVLEAAQVPRHDYCGTDDWFIELDKAVYEATADFGKRYRDKYADSEAQKPTTASRQADKVRWEYEQGFDAPEQVEALDEKAV